MVSQKESNALLHTIRRYCGLAGSTPHFSGIVLLVFGPFLLNRLRVFFAMLSIRVGTNQGFEMEECVR